MRQILTPGLLWFSAIGCGFLAGLYFAFSTFVMTAFARIGQAAGIAAMNSINVEIVRSLFMPLFLGTTLTSTALAVLAFFHWGEPGAMAMLAGGVIYGAGMFIVTMVFNVPLNDALAVVVPSSARSRVALGTLSEGLDYVEPCTDDRVHRCLRAFYRRPRGQIDRRRRRRGPAFVEARPCATILLKYAIASTLRTRSSDRPAPIHFPPRTDNPVAQPGASRAFGRDCS